ncbi:N-acetyltransferase [Nodosilinea sp. E11]|uniref:GNAT family N-acetyltransferase n=1 Tax=Nodosilinea sp. E11 TaxID=3037479 RepID=UPI0029349723|nr:N-acetyltransferase [Nodosilinea sp. E11]WOD38253.1 N-acetyltransferase [Nodosilinea sp. E11]
MIRAEQAGDSEAIYRVNAIAFGRHHEANLVNRLRGLPKSLSLVALADDAIVGPICFSPVTIQTVATAPGLILGLGPVAVLPEHQRQGIGSQLIGQGLKDCTLAGGQAVVVLGDPAFYARFGFIPAAQKQLRCEYTVPDGAFRVLELQSGALEGCQGLVQYRPEFADCA